MRHQYDTEERLRERLAANRALFTARLAHIQEIADQTVWQRFRYYHRNTWWHQFIVLVAFSVSLLKDPGHWFENTVVSGLALLIIAVLSLVVAWSQVRMARRCLGEIQ
jgi:hypothetical protein